VRLRYTRPALADLGAILDYIATRSPQGARRVQGRIKTIVDLLLQHPQEQALKVTGLCHCGSIRYAAEVVPATVRICHCTDCQRLTGTAFRTNIASLPGTFVLTRGTPKTYLKTAESGNKRAHGFCPECGTPLYATSPEPSPQSYGLRVGGIDQRAQFGPPTRQIWCRSALPWSMDISAVAKAERG
jgi:hypothetical protein